MSPLEVAGLVAAALEKIGAAYFLFGSLASSIQGEPRATNDIDFVVDLHEPDIQRFADALGDSFDVDVDALKDATRRRGSWNIFHVPTVVKIDLFIRRTGAFDDSEFLRRQKYTIDAGLELFVKSPEDTILRKLLWFRQGGEVMNSQWRDVVEVLRVSGSSIDDAYVDDWATRLGVSDLVARARRDAALPRRS